MSSVSGPTAAAPLRDTMSLRPQGFYGYAFVFARTAEIMALVAVVGLVGNFIFMMTTSKQSPAASLVITLVFTSIAILWTCCSWNGYSKRYLPYGATWFIDVLFLVPFATVTVLLGLPLSTTTCRDVPNSNFSLNIPAGGRINFTGKGQEACIKLFAVWGILMGVCALFGISAVSAGLLQLGERQLGDALQSARERGDVGYGAYPGPQGEGQVELGNFKPGPPKPQNSWDSIGTDGGRSQQGYGADRRDGSVEGRGQGYGMDRSDEGRNQGYGMDRRPGSVEGRSQGYGMDRRPGSGEGSTRGYGMDRGESDSYYNNNSRPSRQRVLSPEPYRRGPSPEPYGARSPYNSRSPYRSDSVSRSKYSRSPGLPSSVKLPPAPRDFDDDDNWSRSNRGGGYRS